MTKGRSTTFEVNANLRTNLQRLSEQKHYPVSALCKITGISRSAYYKWRHRGKSQNELQNEFEMCH
ncbi:helix-turn-helix domain-containing protein [Caldanaerobius polysaccharolyticus]|uniref:helix-turn-helix domain-containing protein n=1 Tax=Caldanaerobius polysaccharolyticus TaxID=44256 RepID=UPI00047D6EFE|nr:helix-turn-helix domain-containing protein [Caldanaerobius polysaccharolyticus]